MKQYYNGQRKGMAYGGNIRKPAMTNETKAKKMAYGGSMSAPMPMKEKMKPAAGMPMMGMGGKMKKPTKNMMGLPEKVRNKMGYMAHGGKMKKSK